MANTETVTEDRLAVKFDVFRQISLIFMGCCLLAAAILAATQPLPYANDPTLMKYTTGYIGIPLAIGIIAYNAWKLFFRRYAILIDEKGITDHTSLLSPGFIAWDDIKEVYLLRIGDDDFLCVVPNDLDAWLARLSKRQQRLARANMDMGYAPMRIQFKKASERLKSQEGVAFCKKIHPKKVTHVRKIKPLKN